MPLVHTNKPVQLKPGNQHFRVIELPAYEPSGSGEHLWLVCTKSDCTTSALARALAQTLGVPERAIGWAGRKDRHGITTQALTVHFGKPELLAHVNDHLPPGAAVTIDTVSRHKNKLKPGHLRGNQFILGLDHIENMEALTTTLHTVAEQGLINYFGRQRYGRDGSNLSRAIAVGNQQLPLPRDKRQRQYLCDAAQAAIADAVIAGRQAAGLLHTLRPGDVAMTPRGAAFVVSLEDAEDCSQRAQTGALFTSAPLPGSALLKAAGDPHDQEQQWSAATGFSWEWLSAGPLLSRGDRRPAIIPLLEAPILSQDPEHPQQATLSFALPPGCYATTLCTNCNIDLPDLGESSL